MDQVNLGIIGQRLGSKPKAVGLKDNMIQMIQMIKMSIFKEDNLWKKCVVVFAVKLDDLPFWYGCLYNFILDLIMLVITSQKIT
jgi:hypothetical protein